MSQFLVPSPTLNILSKILKTINSDWLELNLLTFLPDHDIYSYTYNNTIFKNEEVMTKLQEGGRTKFMFVL